MPNKDDLLRQIPHVDKLLKNKIIATAEVYHHEAVEAVRQLLAKLREELISGKQTAYRRKTSWHASLSSLLRTTQTKACAK